MCKDPLCPLGISPVEGETMRGGNGKRSGNGKGSGNGKRSGNGKGRSLDEDKDGDKDNIKTSGPTSRMALPLTGEMPKGQRGSVIINNVYS